AEARSGPRSPRAALGSGAPLRVGGSSARRRGAAPDTSAPSLLRRAGRPGSERRHLRADLAGGSARRAAVGLARGAVSGRRLATTARRARARAGLSEAATALPRR